MKKFSSNRYDCDTFRSFASLRKSQKSALRIRDTRTISHDCDALARDEDNCRASRFERYLIIQGKNEARATTVAIIILLNDMAAGTQVGWWCRRWRHRPLQNELRREEIITQNKGHVAPEFHHLNKSSNVWRWCKIIFYLYCILASCNLLYMYILYNLNIYMCIYISRISCSSFFMQNWYFAYYIAFSVSRISYFNVSYKIFQYLDVLRLVSLVSRVLQFVILIETALPLN